MKRIALLLILIICVSLAGCGKVICSIEGCENEAVEDTTYEESYCSMHLVNKQAFEKSQDAYINIKASYDIITDFAVDYYEIWRIGIFEPDQIREQGVQFLAKYLRNISEEELRMGVIMDAQKRKDGGATGLTEEIVNNPDLYLSMSKNEYLWSICPFSVIYAYEISGMKTDAEGFLTTAKIQMKEMSEKYSDYEHYPKLKDLYATISSYFDTCFNQSQSFEQFAKLNKEYEKEASEYIADLDFIFVE